MNAPNTFVGKLGASTGPLLSLAFGGLATVLAREGFEIQRPEFKQSQSVGTDYFPYSELEDPVSFRFTAIGPASALALSYQDSRHVGNAADPAIGTGSLNSGQFSGNIAWGDYVLGITGTVTGATFAGTISVTANGATEVLACLVTDAGPVTVDTGVYYSEFGSDANDGTSLRKAKRTFPAPVDGWVYFVGRQSDYRAEADALLGTGKVFRVEGVGIGRLPLFDQTEVIQAWAAVGAAWQASFSAHVGADSATGLSQVIEDGMPLFQAANLAACQATPGSYYAPTVIGPAPAVITVYVHPTYGNPNTNGLVYEATVRESAIVCAGSSIVRNVHARGATTPSGGVVIRAKATDGTDAAQVRNVLTEYGTNHCIYQASGTQQRVTAMFCQPQGGSSSAFVFHRGGVDLVAQPSPESTNSAHIEWMGRTRGSNETSWDWHSDSPMNAPQILQFGSAYAGGFVFFPSGAFLGTAAVYDAIIKEPAATCPGIFVYGPFDVQRLRHWQMQPRNWPGPKLVTGQTTATILNSFAITGWGNSTPGNTFDGYITPDGGPDVAHATTCKANNCTFININTTSTRRVGFYIAPSNAGHTKISFQLSGNIWSGWTSDWISGDTTPGVGTRIPGDFSTYELLATAPNAFLLNNTVVMTLAQYQAGWFGTYAASDAASICATTTWAPFVGEYPQPVQQTANQGGFTQPFIPVDDYLMVRVLRTFQNNGRLLLV